MQTSVYNQISHRGYMASSKKNQGHVNSIRNVGGNVLATPQLSTSENCWGSRDPQTCYWLWNWWNCSICPPTKNISPVPLLTLSALHRNIGKPCSLSPKFQSFLQLPPMNVISLLPASLQWIEYWYWFNIMRVYCSMATSQAKSQAQGHFQVWFVLEYLFCFSCSSNVAKWEVWDQSKE